MSKMIEASPGLAGNDGPPAGNSSSKIALIQRVLKKRWKEIALASVPCMLLAAVVYIFFGKDVYLHKASVIYNPPPAPEALKGVYVPSDFETQSALIFEPNLIEQLMRSFGMGIPPSIMVKNFKLDPPPFGAKKLTVLLEWQDNEQGAAMVNKLLELFIAQAAENREAILDRMEKATTKSLAGCDERIQALTVEYKKYSDKAGVNNIKRELEQVKNDLAKKEGALDGPRARRDSILAQMRNQETVIEDLKVKAKQDGQDVAQKRINEIKRSITQEEGKLGQLDSDLKTATGKLAVDETLLQQKAIAVEVVREQREKVKGLQKQVEASKKLIAQYKEDIEDAKKNPSSPEMTAATGQLDRLKNDLAGVDAEIKRGGENIPQLEQRLRKLNAAQQESEETATRLEAAEAEHKTLDLQKKAIEHLKNDKRKEFQVASEAKATPTPYYNTGKKLALPALVVPLLLVVGFIVVRDMRSQAWQMEALSGQLGMTVLARAWRERGGHREIDPAEVRGLALKLRGYVSGEGGSILFSSLNEGAEIDELLAQIGRFLAIRDERVLIVDARITQPEAPALMRYVERPVEVMSGDTIASAPPGQSGLVQYLVFEGCDAKDFIVPTGLGAVDLLPAGGPYPQTDVLAAEPMKELLDRMRKEYSVVLIAGPSVVQDTDTEILAAYVQGMVLVLNGPVRDAAPVEDVFQSLRDGDAPLLGSVLC